MHLGQDSPWVGCTLGGSHLGWDAPWVGCTLGGAHLGWDSPWVGLTLGRTHLVRIVHNGREVVGARLDGRLLAVELRHVLPHVVPLNPHLRVAVEPANTST